ncbi:DUF805 domain-containing protein [Aquipuribacter nitratireducens]|uniref:DUF805 domain-containing protein n=1 Tax=Aquipuribacter nitratireducens TaxID=650104 RepID=A0ABW0GQ08_9MICO
MTFTGAVASVLRQYATFDGRARRSEYWWFTLFYALVYGLPYLVGTLLLAGATDPVTGQPTSPGALVGAFLAFGAAGLVALGLLVPTLAVSVRRLHDSGRSGWWYCISFVPFVGGLLLLVHMVRESDAGPNRFGPDPRAGLVAAPPAPAAPSSVSFAYGPGRTLLPGDASR